MAIDSPDIRMARLEGTYVQINERLAGLENRLVSEMGGLRAELRSEVGSLRVKFSSCPLWPGFTQGSSTRPEASCTSPPESRTPHRVTFGIRSPAVM